jgi:hypothetical protein
VKGANLGELEEIVLLTIASMDCNTHNKAIAASISKLTGRQITSGEIHTASTYYPPLPALVIRRRSLRR